MVKKVIINRYADQYGIAEESLRKFLVGIGAIKSCDSCVDIEYLQLIKETFLKSIIGKTFYKDLYPTGNPNYNVRRKTVLNDLDIDEESYELFNVSTGKKMDRCSEKEVDLATLSLPESDMIGFFPEGNISSLRMSSFYQVKVPSEREGNYTLLLVNQYGWIKHVLPLNWNASLFKRDSDYRLMDGPNKKGEIFLLGHLYDREGKDRYYTSRKFILCKDGDNLEDCGDYWRVIKMRGWEALLDTVKLDLSLAKLKQCDDIVVVNPNCFQLFDSLYDESGNKIIEVGRDEDDFWYNSRKFSYKFSVEIERESIIVESSALKDLDYNKNRDEEAKYFYDLNGSFRFKIHKDEWWGKGSAMRIAWRNNKGGLVDSNCQISSPFIYDSISRIETSGDFYSLVKNAPCEKIIGWYIFRIGPSFGLLDEYGRLMVPPKQYKQLIIDPEGIRAIHNNLPQGDPYSQLSFFNQSWNTSGKYDLYDYCGNLINESE